MIDIILATPEVIRKFLPAIISIDSYVTAVEHWEQSHFLTDLPGKWECSRVVFDEEKPVGFMIATFKKESVHINRIAINPQYQGAGIATRLLQLAAISAQLNQKKLVTLKVSLQNQTALEFYQKRGFLIQETSGSNLALFMKVETLLTANKVD